MTEVSRADFRAGAAALAKAHVERIKIARLRHELSEVAATMRRHAAARAASAMRASAGARCRKGDHS
jgi:hypothetical protein